MRLYARFLGMSLSDHGLCKVERTKIDGKFVSVVKGESIEAKTEADVFKLLGLQYRGPTERNTYDSVISEYFDEGGDEGGDEGEDLTDASPDDKLKAKLKSFMEAAGDGSGDAGIDKNFDLSVSTSYSGAVVREMKEGDWRDEDDCMYESE